MPEVRWCCVQCEVLSVHAMCFREAEDAAAEAKAKADGKVQDKGKWKYLQKYYHKGAFFQVPTHSAPLIIPSLSDLTLSDDVLAPPCVQ